MSPNTEDIFLLFLVLHITVFLFDYRNTAACNFLCTSGSLFFDTLFFNQHQEKDDRLYWWFLFKLISSLNVTYRLWIWKHTPRSCISSWLKCVHVHVCTRVYSLCSLQLLVTIATDPDTEFTHSFHVPFIIEPRVYSWIFVFVHASIKGLHDVSFQWCSHWDVWTLCFLSAPHMAQSSSFGDLSIKTLSKRAQPVYAWASRHLLTCIIKQQKLS